MDISTGTLYSYLLNHQNQGLGSEAQIGMGLNLDSGDGAGIDFSLSENVVEESFSVGEIEVPADTYPMRTFCYKPCLPVVDR